MGTTRVEFLSGELVCAGGDYGSLVLAGTTPEAVRTLDTILAGVRYSGRQPRFVFVVDYEDSPTPFIEDRHAGREGTPERGVGADAGGTEPGGEEGLATPEPVGGQASRDP